MQDRPTATELLAAISRLLEQDVIPELTGRLSFHVRVAANVSRIVAREIELGPEHAAADRAALAAMVGHDGDPDALADELAAALRAGDLDDRLDELIEPLRALAIRKLEVAKPEHIRLLSADPRSS